MIRPSIKCGSKATGDRCPRWAIKSWVLETEIGVCVLIVQGVKLIKGKLLYRCEVLTELVVVKQDHLAVERWGTGFKAVLRHGNSNSDGIAFPCYLPLFVLRGPRGLVHVSGAVYMLHDRPGDSQYIHTRAKRESAPKVRL
jgi:hypothetical protein